MAPSGDTSSDISLTDLHAEVKRLNAELRMIREREAHFRTMIEQVSDVVFQLDAGGRFLYVSPAIERYSGYPPDDLINKPFATFIHTDDMLHLRASFARTMDGADEPTEFRVRHRDGSYYYVRTLSKAAKRDGKVTQITGVMIHIDQQKRREKARELVQLELEQKLTVKLNELRESEARFEFMFNHINEPIYIFDLQGWVISANHAGSALLGYAPEEFANLHLANLDADGPSDDDRAADRSEMLANLLGDRPLGEPHHVQRRFHHRNGTTFPVDLSMVKLEYDAMTFVLALATDITEQQKLRRLVRERTHELAEAHAELQHAHTTLERRVRDRTKELESFAYAMSHDLRAPLRAVIGFAELLEQKYAPDLNDEAQHFVHNITSASHQLEALIHSLFTYANLGSHQLQLRHIDAKLVIEEVLRKFQEPIATTRATVVRPESSLTVRADAKLLLEALRQLLSNALLYTAPDTPPQVTFGLEADVDAETVSISITDQGLGILPQHQTKVFRVFQRLQSQDDHPGSGVGLAIAQRCVALMDGILTLKSAEGRGSTFTITLPHPDAADTANGV